MNDALWHTIQQTQVLQNFQDEIQGIWSDQNSRDIHIRHLEPHRSDSAQMLHYFQEQERTLEQAKEYLQAAETALTQARAAGDNVQTHIHLSEEEVRTSIHEYDFFAQYNNKALTSLPQIFELIDKAYKVGSENNPYSDILAQFQRLVFDGTYRFSTSIGPHNDSVVDDLRVTDSMVRSLADSL